MEVRRRNDAGLVVVKDQGLISERATRDEDRLINGLKWSYDYCDRDQSDIQLQIVPEIHKDEENSKKDLFVVVPDEHSETDDHHHSSDNRCYLRKKNEKTKRRHIKIFSDDELEGFTREVPSVTRKGSKRRIDEMMSNKMHTLQQLVPNCHKKDKVSVLDKTIEYMKNLQLQLQVMSTMGMNTYIPPTTLNFGMHNRLMTAMAPVHGLNSANQASSSPLTLKSNWMLLPFTNLSFSHSYGHPLFLTTAPQAFSPQCLHGLVPCFPSFVDFSSHTIGGL